MTDRVNSANTETGSQASATILSQTPIPASVKMMTPTQGSTQQQTSQSPQKTETNAIVYENTYKLKPDKKFQSEPVYKVAMDVLTQTLKKAKYDPNTVNDTCISIANQVLSGVKRMEFDRYKIVVDVTIGEFKGQGIRVASRSLWDTSTDSYVSASFKNGSLFAVVMVFGCYYE